MIQSTELRLGNIVGLINTIGPVRLSETTTHARVLSITLFEIQWIHAHEIPACIAEWNKTPPRDLCGLPLNDEWLKRLGFNNDKGVWSVQLQEKLLLSVHPPLDGDSYQSIYVCVENRDPKELDLMGSWLTNRIKYVHELQNLFFSLTQKELTIK